LQALCLNVKVLSDTNEEIKIKESMEEDMDELG
jgi:DNA-directed RNA polymerase subunit beta